MLRRKWKCTYSEMCEIGDTRTINQDRILVRVKSEGKPDVGLFIVADGCGGLSHGEKISQLIVDGFESIWNESLSDIDRLSRPIQEHIREKMCRWIEQINQAAYSFSMDAGAKVGSTLSALLILDRQFYIFNVGDSRVYLKRKNKIQQLTVDQSQIVDMLRNHEITAEEAAHYPHKNVLSMCIGLREHIQIFQIQGKVKKNDLFLLCSDGLYNGLGEENLITYLKNYSGVPIANEMRKAIPKGRASDNLSCIIAHVESGH